jgi:hypothetical protein
MNLLLVPFVMVIIALLGVSAVAYMYYGQAADYKNNVDAKVAEAVKQSETEISKQKEQAFAEKEKFPYNIYTGPQAAGSIKIQYPKTWSAYIIAPRTTSAKPLDAYFYPGQVPSANDEANVFALRVSVIQQSYDSILQGYVSAQKTGKVTVSAFRSPNVPSLVGARIEGEVAQKKQGVKIMLPFRDKTLQMWTESMDYKGDFDNIILKNFTLTP